MLATMKPTSPTPSSSHRHRLGREHADLLDLVLLARSPSAGSSCPAAMTPSMTRVRMMTPRYGVVPGVEDQRLERRVGIARRRRQPVRRSPRGSRGRRCPSLALARIAWLASSPMMSSICRLRFVRLRARQIDLVDDRDDLEVVLDRQVGVGERLRLDALRRVDEQQRAFARGQRPRDFVGEVDVPGRVDQVEDVGLPSSAL